MRQSLPICNLQFFDAGPSSEPARGSQPLAPRAPGPAQTIQSSTKQEGGGSAGALRW